MGKVSTVIERETSANHEITREDEGLFIYRWRRGDASAHDVTVLADVERKVWPGTHIYSITIADDGLSIMPGALTQAARIYQHSPPRTSAFVVRRHYLRTSLQFLVRTVRLLGVKLDAGFFEEESVARAWIEQKRRERAEQ